MGDFSQRFSRPDAGAHTVEGNASGARAAMLEKKRQAEQKHFDLEVQRKKRATMESTLDIGSKFQPARIGKEHQSFKAKTIGLVSAKEFIEASKMKELQVEPGGALLKVEAREDAKRKKKKKKKDKKVSSRLSFMDDEDDQVMALKEIVSLKDPTVDTSFLADKNREKEEESRRKALEQEWRQQQSVMRTEKLEITYSYWDGSGHRRNVTVTKGATIGEFLDQVRRDLVNDFPHLINVASDSLMYVKEDLILSNEISFADLLATKARGKSGPLFHFDVREDVRLGPLDRRIEKDESHPGKVVERSWFERNKHIFPASRWEVYDPAKVYGKYTIGGGVVNKKNR